VTALDTLARRRERRRRGEEADDAWATEVKDDNCRC
jgi:hypothetical protein